MPTYNDTALPTYFPGILFWSCLQSRFMSQKGKRSYYSQLIFTKKGNTQIHYPLCVHQLQHKMTFIVFLKFNLNQENKDATTKSMQKEYYGYLKGVHNRSFPKYCYINIASSKGIGAYLKAGL